MKNKNLPLSIVVWALVAVLALVIIFGFVYRTPPAQPVIDDGIEEIDLNTIYLENSKVEVSFSDVLLSEVDENRKLIVGEQETEVSTQLTDSLIKKLDFDFMKKTQTVTYKGKGYFVVDLDELTKADIVQDKDKKTVTIKINHARLETVSIDPNQVIIDEVNKSLLAFGKIKMTVEDFNSVEAGLVEQLNQALNTPDNAQMADAAALKAVEIIYEPIIKAIDHRYDVIVEFK